MSVLNMYISRNVLVFHFFLWKEYDGKIVGRVHDTEISDLDQLRSVPNTHVGKRSRHSCFVIEEIS